MGKGLQRLQGSFICSKQEANPSVLWVLLLSAMIGLPYLQLCCGKLPEVMRIQDGILLL
jgi:hypothetical protein